MRGSNRSRRRCNTLHFSVGQVDETGEEIKKGNKKKKKRREGREKKEGRRDTTVVSRPIVFSFTDPIRGRDS